MGRFPIHGVNVENFLFDYFSTAFLIVVVYSVYAIMSNITHTLLGFLL